MPATTAAATVAIVNILINAKYRSLAPAITRIANAPTINTKAEPRSGCTMINAVGIPTSTKPPTNFE